MTLSSGRITSPGVKRFFAAAGTSVLVALMVVLGSSPAQAVGVTGSAVQCGDTLTTSVQLDADLDCAGTAFIIAASDVTVDLGGHTVVGTTSGISAQNQTGVTVTNGTVGGGISLTWVTSSTLSNLHVDSLSLKFSSVMVEDSVIQNGRSAFQGDVTLVRCSVSGLHAQAVDSRITISDSTLTDSGFVSNGTTFTLTGNTLTRFRVNGGENGSPVVTGNKFIQSALTFFIASHFDIENNQFTEGSGLAIQDTVYQPSIVKGNVFDGGTVGVDLDASKLNTITISHNVFVDNSAAGLLVHSPRNQVSRSLTISDNVFASNGKAPNGRVDSHGVPVDDGVHIDVPPASLVTVGDNFTLNNADHGIEAQPGSVVDGGGNISVGDPAGCLGVVCR